MDFDIFGTYVTDKVGNQKTLYYAAPNDLCFCSYQCPFKWRV